MAICAFSPRGPRSRKRRGRRIACSAMSTRRSIIRSPCGWRPRARLSTKRGATVARPIFVGGTGLYFKALTQGLSGIPAVPAEVRAAVRARGAQLPVAELHGELAPSRSRDGGAASAERSAADFAGARGSGGDGEKPCRLPGRADCALARHRRRAGDFSRTRARRAEAAHQYALRGDAGGGRAGGGRGAPPARSR